MSDLMTRNGKGYKRTDEGWQELSAPDYHRETIYQNEIANRDIYDRFMPAVGKYAADLGSGISQLFGGEQNAQEEQQYRADLQQQYQPQEDYGGKAEAIGSFMAPMASAALPGGLWAQLGYGTAQGMAEDPNNPATGAAFGFGGTVAGEWLGNSLGRIGNNLRTKRVEMSPDPHYRDTVQAAQDQGFEFTPGQRSGDQTRIRMENQLRKTPRFAHLDAQRFMDNQARLNNLAAETLGVPQMGRVTPQMRGAAKDSVKKAFDSVASESAPVTILGKDFVEAAQGLRSTDQGTAWLNRFVNEFPDTFGKNEAMSGEQFMQVRNWVAAQSRNGINIKEGIADELQPMIRALDDSLEAANIDTPLMDEIARARTKWKALLVVENSLRSGRNAAQGNITPDAAYAALKKYDKGGIFRGRRRGPFDSAVDALTMVGDVKAPQPPSQDPGRNLMQFFDDMLFGGPAAEGYMRGDKLGDLMLGISGKGDLVPGLNKAAIGAERGLMSNDEDYPE